MNLVFLGPPGAGKGTQARLFGERHGVPPISTGDMLRAAAAAGTPMGAEAAEYMRRGELVPDPVMIEIIAQRLQERDAALGFVLDGFPRTIAQADGLDAVLARLGRRLDRVIYFEIGEATAVRRLGNRRVCRAAGHIYNLASNPPKTPGICDADGSPLFMRDDDRPETVSRRLQVYREQTEPLLDFYRHRGLLVTLDAEGGVDEVAAALDAVVASLVTR